ncbi:MAG: Hsp20/alpha crystallin family protein [Desulfobacteraceae bacterium]|nr:Hsp20/alpha crystallin family protein [Desulfobacteraceae bacterium]
MFTRGFFDFPDLGWRSPFEEMDRMRRYIDQLMGQAESGYALPRAGVFPLINLTESKEAYILRAELPGVKAGDLDIQATGRNITISGERKIETDQNATYHRRERSAGSFSRALTLPGEIDRDKIEASLKDGVLTVSVPKSEKAKAKQIEIKS